MHRDAALIANMTPKAYRDELIKEFGTLIDAQALGDLRSLRAHDRRVARVTLEQLAGSA